MNEIMNWATTENSERPNNFSSLDYILLNVNVVDIFSCMDDDFKLDIYDCLGGKNAIGNRLDRAKEHFISGEPMDYPEVAYSSYSKKINFTNGRHRSVAAFQLGCNYVPMFIYKETLADFMSLVRTKPLEQSPKEFLNKKIPEKQSVKYFKNNYK
jgi:hypothetical protein